MGLLHVVVNVKAWHMLQFRLSMKELAFQSRRFSVFQKFVENLILHMIGTNTCLRTLCEIDLLALHCSLDS